MPPSAPPEFIADRCLGRRTVTQLRDLGWRVLHLSDVYPDDGRNVPDEEWIAAAARNGWAVLTQDERIRYLAAERGALVVGSLPMFCLSNGNLRIADKVWRFHQSQAATYQEARSGETAIYAVHEDRIARKWP
ncbi:DUF5615 family PIN-like protein [Kitasatospora sp. NPDC059571]|uniref:DUF5615 family PIN-like protein n=1 Tax=Kitasatospora sp. NPDC059571 TaxID=3346871 RepID=UPI003673E148